MKTKISFLFLCTIFMFLGRHATYAQVTIGLGEEPEKYATLQIKDVEQKTMGSPDAPTAAKGGFLLPRVNLVDKNELQPFVAITEMSSEEYLKAKKSHTGLIVYNLVEDPVEDLCLGLNQWDGEQWNCFEFRTGNATAELGDCNQLAFEGEYKNGITLTPGNYMTIPIKVSKTGAYTITARVKDAQTNTDDNGYYFTISGTFLTIGNHILTVPGAGTPIKFTPDNFPGDHVTITFNGKNISGGTATECLKYIKVEDSSIRPRYSMTCGSIKVTGSYKVGQELDPEKDFIELSLNVEAPFSAAYDIKTEIVEGIHFEGTGILDEASQKIKLKGHGTPVGMTDKVFTITTNSVSSSANTCNTTVMMAIPKKRILVLGNELLHGYNISLSGTGSNKVLTSPKNFGRGEDAVVKSDGFEFVNGNEPGIGQRTSDIIVDNGNELKAIRKVLLEDAYKTDIVVLTQNTYMEYQTQIADVLVQYLNKGGVIVAFWEANGLKSASNFMNRVFGTTNITDVSAHQNGAIYSISNINDEILNGPFGDVRGKQWGEDASSTRVLQNLPLDQIDIYSTSHNISTSLDIPKPGITGFKHKTLNLVWFGDGGFNSSGTNGRPDVPNMVATPFWWDETTMFPLAKPNYGYATKYPVSNSIIFCNIMAWAIQRAESNGINTKH